jgi:citrate lyase subunit beta/citryl-CoA lyase
MIRARACKADLRAPILAQADDPDPSSRVLRAPELDDPACREALARLVRLRPAAILAPCAGPQDAQAFSVRLAVAEAEAGLPDGATPLIASLSRAAAFLRLEGWRGASARLIALAFDPASLAADLKLPALREDGALVAPLAQARAMTVFAAAAAGLSALDAPFAGARDDQRALAEEARTARRDGFAGKFARGAHEARVIEETFARAGD